MKKMAVAESRWDVYHELALLIEDLTNSQYGLETFDLELYVYSNSGKYHRDICDHVFTMMNNVITCIDEGKSNRIVEFLLDAAPRHVQVGCSEIGIRLSYTKTYEVRIFGKKIELPTIFYEAEK